MSIKTRPILFSAPMVRAILNDRKSQTRRIMKPQPHCDLEQLGECEDMLFGATANGKTAVWRSPFGNPGDRLWVRETWGLHDTDPKDGPKNAIVYYRSTDGDRHDLRYQLWRPSIHMPRWASRITLEITGVDVERLHDISDDDIAAEGVTQDKETDHPRGVWFTAWRQLWESINGEGSWNANPWVWVVSFERVD